MMRHPEHHHVPPNAMQRNRLNMQQMTPPAQRMLMTMPGSPHSSVLVSMPSGQTLITTTAIAPIQHPQQQQPPKTTSVQQPMYYEAHTMNEEQAEIPVEQQHSPVTNTTTSSAMPNLANIKEKTPMCLVNELARYNKIQHQYRLTGEQGPAHKKIFTVTLKLGNEEYEAEGPSIKKAQHSAAAQALAKTQLKHPPPKTNRNSRTGTSGMVTPTVELNALAMKRGERTVYIVKSGPAHHAPPYMPQAGGYYPPRHNLYNPQSQPRYNCDMRRSHQVRGPLQYDNRYYNQFKPGFQHNNGEFCTVRLRIADREYGGSGMTIQAARHDAAAKAVEDIKRLNAEEGRITDENNVEELPVENGETDVNTELKSPISLVHEIALKRHLNVVFEVLSEKGPPHMKVFVTQCRIGDIVVEGEGNGKKKSKKRAAEKMLEKLAKFPPLPNMNSMSQLKRKRVTNKKKTRNLIKVNADKSSEFTEEINPISRLIQIQQANKEKEPVYTVVEERGAPRRREFVMQASVNGISCNGVGPNKKVAKRNAAQALLTALGYANPPSSAPKQTASVNKVEKEPEIVEKPRKVTFLEEKQESPVGGSGGRQLVPGLLLVGDQSITMQNKPKSVAENVVNRSDKKLPTKIPPPPSQGVRSKDKLLYLAQLLNIHVQFSDFPKANHEMYLTLVSLNTNPPQVCHGEGPTTEASHEKAALEALNVLSELGLDSVTPCKENSEGVKSQMAPKVGLTQNGNKK